MNSTRTLTDRILLFLKGLGMGAANKVPGVSGGVVAFVAGFYEEFIYSLQKFNGKALRLLLNGRFKSFYDYVNGRFLGTLILGMLFSYFSVSKLLDYFIERHELYVWSLFFGMIIGSIFYISRGFKDWNYKTILALVIGMLLGIGVSFLEPAKENDNIFFVFFCGMISVSGMTLPGFSGSFILILLGNYVLLLVDAVNALYDTFIEVFSGDFSFVSNPLRLKLLRTLVVFTLGSAAGLVSLSHVLSYILKRWRSITMASIIGFIIGSLGVVWPWKERVYKTDSNGETVLDSYGNPILANYDRFIPEAFTTEVIYAILFTITGIAIVLGLGFLEKRNSKAYA